jgi:hypothetical protein
VFGVVCDGVLSWNSDGKEYATCESPNDLFMATEKKTVWVNVYVNKSYASGFSVGEVFDDRADALAVSIGNKDYIRTYSIEIEV